MKKSFEDKIKETLVKQTDTSIELKEEIWKRIEKSIDKNNANKEEHGIVKKQKPSKKRFWGLGTIAAALIVMFLAGTAPGHATIDRIKELFVPEKTIVEEIEGQEEQTDVSLQKSKLGYVIYFDEERYVLETIDGKDKIAPKEQADYVPEVFMEIEQIEGKTIENLAPEIKNALEEEYGITINIEEVEDPVKGIVLHGTKGKNWDDIVVRCYLVDNTQGGTFIIKQQYFLEAAEGFGHRFYNMLKEFEIVTEEE
ncbi:hypothetical protein [Clostridium formicaceticum]|uniref:DUF4367 domain-containing protein n=1 Tax=Clostridium formicaceticum TaxID=1497 RepID=A0AAC9RMD4_9CLOT|nr:hypothetical protein [Clostridium formicaceticum]AOY75295.1 hypothetical protein BJL90_04865 [Clostridium formicaceticum]ARE89734.1 hypothetical protein CLFO_42150 [Clostridium formicaceticum]